METQAIATVYPYTVRSIVGKMVYPGRRSTKLILTAALAAALCIPLPVRAQNQTSDQASDQPSSQTSGQASAQAASQSSPAADAQAQSTPDLPQAPAKKITKNDRIFGIMPNYATVETKDTFAILTPKEKFKLSYESIIDRYTFPFIGVVALIGQAQNSEPSYGQGFEGYGKRYGTSFADAAIGTTMTTSVFPSLLRQDPRYYQLGHGSLWHRAEYSVSRLFVTRGDSGNPEINSSEIVGNLIAAGISNAYHPTQERTVSNTLSVWGTDIMWDGVSNALKEFWPDIRHHFTKKHQSD